MNKTTILLFAMFLLVLPGIRAQKTAEKAFPQFTWTKTGVDNFLDSRFGYDKNTFTLVKKRCDALPQTDACYSANNDEDFTLLGRYKNASMTESVNILYSPGPSADPLFRITDARNNVIWEYTADEMCINASGVIYTAGHSNKMFNERTKWQLSGHNVREVKQPYLYVGFKGKLLRDVKLFSQKTGGVVVATLPKGYEIEVLLSETDPQSNPDGFSSLPKNYLARSAFGLVGWLRLTDDETYVTPVLNELRYWGD